MAEAGCYDVDRDSCQQQGSGVARTYDSAPAQLEVGWQATNWLKD